ncbi:hypothetical protein [Clostridium sp. UBA1652]|nr:hypothetical protein [Clostridium sp. UBA1652]
MKIIELNPERREAAEQKLAEILVGMYLKSLWLNKINSKCKGDKKP